VNPTLPIPPADNLTTILNAARAYASDKLSSLYPTGGKILDNTDAFSQQIVNNGWRKMQEQLADWGNTAFKQEVIFTGFPIITSANPGAAVDPAAQVYINWSGYFNGAVFVPSPPAPAGLALPADCTRPLKIWERPSGYNAPFPTEPMGVALDGLPTYQKGLWLGGWEWRANAVYMPGSLLVEDLRMLYRRFLPDFADVSATSRWWQQPVDIPRCQEPFAWYICWALAAARGQGNADALPLITDMLARASDSLKLVMNVEIDAKQRVNTRRQSRSGRLEHAGNAPWGGNYSG